MKKNNCPLAELLRPQKVEQVIGQAHLLAAGKPLKIALDSGVLHSMILWGPPGVGKTTLARLMAQAFNAHFMTLSAVFAGVKDIRAAVEEAKCYAAQERRSILFIDEIHRFNKSQQDALLPHTESGLITFIGATTENPSFEINSALLSRAQVYVLAALDESALTALYRRAQSEVMPEITLEEDALKTLIEHADGDGRRFLNLLEQVKNAAHTGNTNKGNITTVDSAFLGSILAQKRRRFDKSGDVFYDHISALHKSVRGSDPDASLYWLCRMLDGGADPRYLARRIIRIAWEDIGLADPRALQIANDATLTYERLGSPEGELALAQAVLYLAIAAKSNAGYKAYNQAKAFVEHDKSSEVPLHLRNAPTKMMKNLGYGSSYRYSHDEPNAYSAGQRYLPEGMAKPHWYQPTQYGLEAKITLKMKFLNDLDRDKK